MKFTDAALERIAKESYSFKFGARNMRRYIETHVEDELAEQIISSRSNRVTHVSVDAAENEGLTLQCIKLH